MLLFGGAFGLLALAVWVFCVIDVLTTPADRVRSLPKLAWIAVVVLLVDLGAIAWLVAGRPWGARTPTPGGPRSSAGTGPAPLFPGRRRPAARAVSPDDDEDFLRDLDRRLREQRREDGDTPA